MRQLLDYDPIHGVSCYFNADDDEFRFTYEQDTRLVKSIIDQNQRDAANDDKTKKGIKNDWWKYAVVPTVVELEWLQKYGVSLGDPEHSKKVFQLLNHPDYRYLRCTSKIHRG